MGGKGYKPRKDYAGRTVSGDWEDSDRGAGNKAKKRAGGKVEKKSPTYQAYVLNKEHHQKDAEGKVIEHCDGTPSSVEEDYYRGTGEKVVARTKKWMDKKGQKGAPGLDAMKARTAEHKAKRGVKSEGYQRDPDRQEKERKTSKQSDPSKDNFTGISGSIATIMKQNAAMKKAAAKKKGVKEETDAYKYVVSKLKKKYGSGVLTKGDKIKPQSAADKAKARAHQAKVDAENAAERKKDPSQGRYPKGYSNRGSD